MKMAEMVAELDSVQTALDNLKLRSMAYDGFNKELLADELNLPFDIFFDLPYSQWQDFQRWGKL